MVGRTRRGASWWAVLVAIVGLLLTGVPGAGAGPDDLTVDSTLGNGIATGAIKDQYAAGRAIVTVENDHSFWVAIEPADSFGSMTFDPAPTTGVRGDLGGAWATIAVIPPGGTAAYDLSWDPTAGGGQSFRVHYDGTSAGGLAATALNVLQLIAIALGEKGLEAGAEAVERATHVITDLPEWVEIVRTNQGDAMALTDLPKVAVALISTETGRRALVDAMREVGLHVDPALLGGIATGVARGEAALLVADLLAAVVNGSVDGSVAFSVLVPVPSSVLPSPSPLPAGTVTAISAGEDSTCAIRDGEAWCWGGNAEGAVGADPSVTASLTTPGRVGRLKGVTDIAVGTHRACAVVQGSAWCWGSNASGQLGDGTTTSSHIPVQVLKLQDVTAVAVRDQSCAIADHAAWCWGASDRGRLGNGSLSDSLRPVRVRELRDVTAISAGDVHTCALADGAAWCWGADAHGVLGDGSETDSAVPVRVALDPAPSAIVAGSGHTCAIVHAEAWCWGWNPWGQVGDGTTTDALAPTSVTGMSHATAITAAGGHSCAIGAGAIAWCWGRNSTGELGDGTFNDSMEPVEVIGLTGVRAIAAGGSHTCAIADYGLWCWGANGSGQLGDGTGVDSAIPVFVGF